MALSVDFTEDHRIGDEILKGVSDQYRKLRNTFRYLLGALDGYNKENPAHNGTETQQQPDELPELERYMLALLAQLDATLKQAVKDFDYNTYVRALTDFCNEDLSAFYFDIRKDCLYCDAESDPKRIAYRFVLDTLFHALIRYAAPVLVFTAEEVWGTRFPDGGSVHLLEWPVLPGADATLTTPLAATSPRHPREGGDPAASDVAGTSGTPDQVRGDELVEKWAAVRDQRMLANERIEPLRREKVIGSSLEAEYFYEGDPGDVDLAEIFIVAAVHKGPTDVKPTTHHKCGRCWRHLPEVTEDGALCSRCDQVVAGMDAAA